MLIGIYAKSKSAQPAADCRDKLTRPKKQNFPYDFLILFMFVPITAGKYPHDIFGHTPAWSSKQPFFVENERLNTHRFFLCSHFNHSVIKNSASIGHSHFHAFVRIGRVVNPFCVSLTDYLGKYGRNAHEYGALYLLMHKRFCGLCICSIICLPFPLLMLSEVIAEPCLVNRCGLITSGRLRVFNQALVIPLNQRAQYFLF